MRRSGQVPYGIVAGLMISAAGSVGEGQSAPPPTPQQASPMQESTRRHERLVDRSYPGLLRNTVSIAGKPVELFIPQRTRSRDRVDLLIHFHGTPFIARQAAAGLEQPVSVATINLGAGSGIYDRSFRDPAVFDSLLTDIFEEVRTAVGPSIKPGRVILTGFSAGHGAIRAILREPRHADRVDAVLLMDGLHTSYIPEGKVLADGGVLDSTNLLAIARYARAAMDGSKRLLITHSEIFPGTFASTTETADWLVWRHDLPRVPVLQWGPRGMQQLSTVHAGRFMMRGFAGNTGPDHLDHLHAMPELLRDLLRP
jgi:hypothetical protein